MKTIRKHFYKKIEIQKYPKCTRKLFIKPCHQTNCKYNKSNRGERPYPLIAIVYDQKKNEKQNFKNMKAKIRLATEKNLPKATKNSEIPWN